LTDCQSRVNKKRKKGKKVYEYGRSLYMGAVKIAVEEHAEGKENTGRICEMAAKTL